MPFEHVFLALVIEPYFGGSTAVHDQIDLLDRDVKENLGI